MAERDDEAGEMEKGSVHFDLMLITHQQSAKVAQPGQGPFDSPALAVAAQATPAVERGFAQPSPMRTSKQDAALKQPPAHRIAVVTKVGNDPQCMWLRTTPARAWNGASRQRAFGQSQFRRTGRTGRDQPASQRNTLAVEHQHPLRPIATLGFAEAVTPFFAGAKFSSRKLSCQSSRPRWFWSPRKAHQRRSQIPCSSQDFRGFRQPVGLTPNSFGRSRLYVAVAAACDDYDEQAFDCGHSVRTRTWSNQSRR